MDKKHRKFIDLAAAAPATIWLAKIFVTEGAKLLAAFILKYTWDKWRSYRKKQSNEQNTD